MITNEQIEQIDKMTYPDRFQLAESTDNVDILEYLSNDECWVIRRYVAMNAHTPTVTLIKLSNDEDSNVRYRIVLNTHTPTDILRKLSGDKHKSIRDETNVQLSKRKCINIDKHTIKGILE